MESLFVLLLVGAVLAMAIGLYRIAKHAIGALRTCGNVGAPAWPGDRVTASCRS